ncbi:MAG: hypothetical protein V4517_29085 [Pseudomonadota bacterium]
MPLLRALFDLSPAEAKLAAALSLGGTLKQAADDARVGIGTARSNLENVFRKTGRTSAEPTGRAAQECAAVERTGSGIAIHRRELHLAIIETLGFNLGLVRSQPASMV